MNSLQKFLLANAVFSLLTGLSLLLWPGPLGAWLGQDAPWTLRILGLVLLGWSGYVYGQSARPRLGRVLEIVVLDLVWVLGSTGVLLARPFELSGQGQWTVAGVGLVVLLLAMGQGRALAQWDELPEKGFKRLVYQREVEAPAAETWELVSDVGHYHHFAPNIDGVEILSGQQKGMVRSCSHGKDSWQEVCTLWSEPRMEYAFKVDTEAPDYPFPLRHLEGRWKVEELGPGRSRIVMAFEFQYRRGFQKVLLHPMMKPRFLKICAELCDNWERALQATGS